MSNKTFIANVDARQCVAAAFFALTLADFAANDGVVEVAMPNGAQVVGGSINVTTEFDDGDSATIAVGTPGTPGRYLAAHTVATAGRTALVSTGFQHLSDDSGAAPPVLLTLATGDGDATEGEVWVEIQYVVAEKSEWTQD